MSERPPIFKSVTDSVSKSRFKDAKELSKLIRGAKRESYPGIPELDDDFIVVEDEQGPCEVSTHSLDWLELSLLIENKLIILPGHTKKQLADARIFIPEKQSIN
jgi:hypothetical protein